MDCSTTPSVTAVKQPGRSTEQCPPPDSSESCDVRRRFGPLRSGVRASSDAYDGVGESQGSRNPLGEYLVSAPSRSAEPPMKRALSVPEFEPPRTRRWSRLVIPFLLLVGGVAVWRT